ncbi:MAG: transposase [Gammaproteobacteria bacterium]|nr:transposase [Gammaproteobacteria bacterium]
MRNYGHRRSIRLKKFDYSQRGAYFITLCVQNRACLLGDIGRDMMVVNCAGEMLERWWCEMEHKFPSIILGEYVVMPNHFHAIIRIVSSEVPRQAPLSKMVQWFKTMSTNAYIRGVKEQGWPVFDGSLWQRNYYEHVIRDERSYDAISAYIQTNPVKWQQDKYFIL